MARLFRLRNERSGRLWVELEVTRAHLNTGDPMKRPDTNKPGRKLFTGLWYGRDPLDFRNYGKMIDVQDCFPVGQLSSRTPAKTLRQLK